MAMIQAQQKFEVFPLNQTGANPTFSYRSGNPLLVFELASSDLYLMPDIRLNFTFRVLSPDPAGGVATVPNNNNASGTGGRPMLTNSRIGATSAIETITISNLSNNVLENCRNYGRLMASTLPANSGWGDYSTYMTQWFGATQNTEAQGKMLNKPLQCSMPILTGIFAQNEPIPLSYDNGTGGLRLQFALSPSVAAMITNDVTEGGAAQTVEQPQCFYELLNVSLTGSYGVPTGGVLPNIDQLRFSAYQSYYQVLNNSDQTSQINCGLGAVSSVFTNFVPTTHLSSVTQDAYKTTSLLNVTNNEYDKLAPIVAINFLKGGVKYPLMYEISSQVLVDGTGPAADPYLNSSYESLRQWNFQNAVRPLTRTLDCLGGARSEGLSVGAWGTGAGEQTGVTAIENTKNDRVYGIGVRFDAIQNGSTTSFKGMPYSFRITSRLDGISPMSAYTFFLHRGVITYNNNGTISVST
jgi:hypothetical protein